MYSSSLNRKNDVCLCCVAAGLGEFRIRDLNDEINKLLREKRHWEERILELGGPDHNVRENAVIGSYRLAELSIIISFTLATSPWTE